MRVSYPAQRHKLFRPTGYNVAVYPCEGGGRNPGCEAALAAAIESDIESRTEGWRRVTRLYRGTEVPEERCWLRAPGWSLAFE